MVKQSRLIQHLSLALSVVWLNACGQGGNTPTNNSFQQSDSGQLHEGTESTHEDGTQNGQVSTESIPPTHHVEVKQSTPEELWETMGRAYYYGDRDAIAAIVNPDLEFYTEIVEVWSMLAKRTSKNVRLNIMLFERFPSEMPERTNKTLEDGLIDGFIKQWNDSIQLIESEGATSLRMGTNVWAIVERGSKLYLNPTTYDGELISEEFIDKYQKTWKMNDQLLDFGISIVDRVDSIDQFNQNMMHYQLQLDTNAD